MADRRGGVAIIAAMVLPVMIGFAAFAVEYSHALTVQTEQQRVADLASYAGALAYGKAKSEESMRASALSVAQLHGIPASTIAVSLIASPRTQGGQAVSVSIRSPWPLHMAKVLGAADSTIASAALAEVGSSGSGKGAGCVIALDPGGTGITMSGGTTLNAPKCTIASNATITSPCGTKIVADGATYNSAIAPDQPSWCRTIQKQDGTPAQIAKAGTSDPLAENKTVLAAVARLDAVAKLKAPNLSGADRGKNLDFNPWDTGKRLKLQEALAAQGCTATYGSMWVVTCDPTRRTFTFGDFLIESGQTVEFNVNGRADAVYTFASIKSQGGGSYRFGPGTFVVPGGITMGGSEARFGAGSFEVGQGPCGFSICGGNNGIMAIAGPSSFDLPFGILVDGGNKATLGAGGGNSYRIGASSTGQAIHVRSGSLVLAGASGAASRFEAVGRISTGGGSCLALPESAHHDIAGSVDVQGALELGAGVYTIDGFLGLGQTSGGAASCNGRTTSLLARNVTIVLSGKELMSGWACQGTAYCAASGYNNMVLISPTSGEYAQLALIGPTKTRAGATLTGGAGGGTIGGAFYFPRGAIKMDGGASASGAGSNCLTMIGTSITVAGGTAAASECEKISGGSSAPATIARLVR